MPDTASRHDAAACEFAELICADSAWLCAEFEVIVTTGFGAAPALPPQHADDSRPQRTGQPAERRVGTSVWRTWPPRHRERSPPLPSDNTTAVISLGR
ncbi:hypothetical protein ATK30_7645 [Amycolatopsis echigonensis]|uniref:Uncharacterized protein n=1 Tax=Amycolatopsis echigonensis TaxID=2576905 RepID=A0A2N3WS67_9PSEU|nr:hypothetical protein ATK30_7645 [Amycolatopsis niigatensis]